MIRSLLVLAFVLCAVSAEAAPRWRKSNNTYSTPTTTSTMPRVESYTSSMPTTAGHIGSAQGVAELMASRGVMGHFGGNSGYEGVGMGSTPEDALGRCCYSNSGMAVVDQGVACGRNGKWYACKRYGR